MKQNRSNRGQDREKVTGQGRAARQSYNPGMANLPDRFPFEWPPFPRAPLAHLPSQDIAKLAFTRRELTDAGSVYRSSDRRGPRL
jgi:hypothetical protein